jgi:hypothetical protein
VLRCCVAVIPLVPLHHRARAPARLIRQRRGLP